ncbi:MAG: amidase [Epulopiscium sp. Nuni2H_MBin001]|nr:MAG: amidase [Epulopiscium sp. Nuni2H_MBin001]
MKRVLVVIDMQNDFIDGILGTAEAVKIVPKVLAKIKKYEKYMVYFTKDTHFSDYLQTQEGRNLPVEHCIRGTKGWELQPDIEAYVERLQQQHLQPIVFEKTTFGSEQLPQTIKNSLLQGDQVEIELVGLCTDICVISNAMLLKAFLPEAIIKVDAQCCAGVTKQSHINALNAMKMCQIQIYNE